MSRRKQSIRVRGPYPHRSKWRIDVILRTGSDVVREIESFESQGEAERIAGEYRRRAAGEDAVETVIADYERHLREKGNKGSSIETTLIRLGRYLDGWRPIGSITPDQIRDRYAARAKAVRPDTSRNEIAELRTFFRWAVSEGLRQDSPVDGLRMVGKRSRGKPQLRRMEARAFFQLALSRARRGDEKALASLVQLSLGLRSSEVLQRRVRDLDVGAWGTVLCIDQGKTRAAGRQLDIPEPVAGLLRDRVRGRPRDDLIFHVRHEPHAAHHPSWLRKAVNQLCLDAGIPKVSPHGLRGTFSSLAAAAGVASHAVAKELGHENEAITLSNYVRPEAIDQQKTSVALRVLAGGAE